LAFLFFSLLYYYVLYFKVEKVYAHDRIVFLWTVVSVLLTVYVSYTRPYNYVAYTTTDVLLLFTIYVLVPNNLIFRLISCLLFTVLSMAVIFFCKHSIPTPMLNLALFSYILTNVLGFVLSVRMYSYRRYQFVARMEEKKAKEAMEQLAIRDDLTGVLNRRKFYEIAESEFSRYQRYKHPFSLILMDLDYFKKINDRYGHLAGDEVLIKFAQGVDGMKRINDVFARWGGEEFVLLLPETPAREAYIFAQRIREEVSMRDFPVTGETVRITTSMGIAQANEDASLDGLVKRADDALYKAKEGGRDRIEMV